MIHQHYWLSYFTLASCISPYHNNILTPRLRFSSHFFAASIFLLVCICLSSTFYTLIQPLIMDSSRQSLIHLTLICATFYCLIHDFFIHAVCFIPCCSNLYFFDWNLNTMSIYAAYQDRCLCSNISCPNSFDFLSYLFKCYCAHCIH